MFIMMIAGHQCCLDSSTMVILKLHLQQVKGEDERRQVAKVRTKVHQGCDEGEQS
jgi:hypothetical protein